jgi:hypothetical protein
MQWIEIAKYAETTLKHGWTDRTGSYGRVVNIPASNSEGTGFKSRPGDRLSGLNGCGFRQFLQENSGIVP